MADGSGIEVLGLTPDQFICEKILAYSNRRYIRNLYDIIDHLETPVDERVLKTIVYSGLAPSMDVMEK